MFHKHQKNQYQLVTVSINQLVNMNYFTVLVTSSMLSPCLASVLSPKTGGCVDGFCSDSGTCALNSTGNAVCTCLVGYLGDNCEIDPCQNLDPCVGRGDCTVINHDPICICNQPWAGTSCQSCDCGDYSDMTIKSV